MGARGAPLRRARRHHQIRRGGRVHRARAARSVCLQRGRAGPENAGASTCAAPQRSSGPTPGRSSTREGWPSSSWRRFYALSTASTVAISKHADKFIKLKSWQIMVRARVLVTGAGGPAGINTIRAIRDSYFVISTDIDEYSEGFLFSHKHYLIHPAKDDFF